MTAVSPRSKSRSRKAPGRRSPRRKQINWKSRIFSAGALLIFGWIMWAVAVRAFAPETNTELKRFDAIVVLGHPADDDGNPTPLQLASVTEAVHEYEQGIAPHVIFTGAAVKNRFVEAQIMARTAEAQGVPPTAIIIEPSARDTVQNACYATRLMKAHGWQSAEVISNPSHLRRAALAFKQMPIQWRTHPALPLQPASSMRNALVTSLETLKTMHFLIWASWRGRCEP